MTTNTFSVIGKSSYETNFFRHWKKLQYTQPFPLLEKAPWQYTEYNEEVW